MSYQMLDQIVDSLAAGHIGLDDFMRAVEDRLEDFSSIQSQDAQHSSLPRVPRNGSAEQTE